ncbi:hypothetical protein GGR92_004934 [Spirosoma lacussanchae]|uniref:DUF6799 domain-containing protein n=1 Tax=Spirosoma lacussanchae TaxID=1884249 RepID=UPI00110838BE|nr:DUF6799 domain-containing protein [Spirosoma lacussanchae]
MKTMAFALTLMLLGVFGITYGQSEHSAHKAMASQTKQAGQAAHEEYMVMHNGKMMMVHQGKMTPMTMDMTMSDGTLCMTDGTCKRKDGTVVKMKEGDHCMIENGEMVIHVGGEKMFKQKKSKINMKGMKDE